MPKNVTFAALFQKKTADLSDGWYARGAPLDPANRSRYNQFAGTEPATLSMSILQAILAVLSQHVGNFRTAQNGGIGTVWLWSTSVVGTGTDFSWDLRDPGYAYVGGFVNGLTYQMVVLHLLWCVLTEQIKSQPQSNEVFVRWQDLLASMDTCRFARGITGGWSKVQVARACRHAQIQPYLERVADALWFSLRSLLPDQKQERSIMLDERNLPIPRTWETLGSGKDLLLGAPLSEQEGCHRPSLRPARLAQPLVLDRAENGPDGREKRLGSARSSWLLPEMPERFF
jgi:hypothetical protein